MWDRTPSASGAEISHGGAESPPCRLLQSAMGNAWVSAQLLSVSRVPARDDRGPLSPERGNGNGGRKREIDSDSINPVSTGLIVAGAARRSMPCPHRDRVGHDRTGLKAPADSCAMSETKVKGESR